MKNGGECERARATCAHKFVESTAVLVIGTEGVRVCCLCDHVELLLVVTREWVDVSQVPAAPRAMSSGPP